MPGKELVIKKVQDILIEGGRAYLHSLAPDDFEYYACAFQVVDSITDIEYIFNFPVMPNAIQINKKPHVNIKKTMRGYVDTISTSFSGPTINISGTFGRKFRLLIQRDNHANQETKKKSERAEDYKKDTFDLNVKTGYGATKLLEKVLKRSTQLDQYARPYRILFYNFAYNESYHVEVISFSISQSLENNAMWNYSIELKAIGSTDFFQDNNKNIKNMLAQAAVQKMANNTFSNLTLGGLQRGFTF
jgi:hypothetical protein